MHNPALFLKIYARGRFIESGCRIWQGKLSSRGYGQVKLQGKWKVAHREIYKALYGDLASTQFVCHACDNRACMTPAHLFLGSAQDNVSDMISKGRAAHQKGTAVHQRINNGKIGGACSKLTLEDYKSIFTLRSQGLTNRQIAKCVGYSDSDNAVETIREILNGHRFKYFHKLLSANIPFSSS